MQEFELSPEEYRRCEQQAIISSFMDITPSEHPKALFVLAQPGAGKTGLTSFVKLEFDNKVGESILHIDPDRIGVFHKYYAQIMRETPTESYNVLQRFTNPATKAINAMALEQGVNILTEGTFRDKAGYLAIIGNLRSKNYEIELNLMAVDSLESMISAMERYYQMIESGLPPRNVERVHHDRAYTGMLDTLRTVENNGDFSRIRIFTRGEEERVPNLVYSRTREDAHLSATEALIRAREAERQKIMRNPVVFQGRIDRIKAAIQKHGNNEKQWNQIMQIEEEFKQLLQTRVGHGEK